MPDLITRRITGASHAPKHQFLHATIRLYGDDGQHARFDLNPA
jgi:hypothetical protein